MKRFIVAVLSLSILTTGCLGRNDGNTPPEEKPEAESEKSAVEILLEGMTIEEKIGQLFIVGFEGTELNEDTVVFLKEHRIGGVIIFGRNIQGPEQVMKLTDSLQALKNGPEGVGLFIGTDQEGGSVNRLPGEHGKFPSARVLASENDPDTVKMAAAQMAIQLKEIGINLNFAPVLDINSNPDNPVIGDRAFGNNPDIVTSMGAAFIEGTLDQGMIPVAKHFPGHGDTGTDSHRGLPIITHPMERLEDFELLPFKEAIENGVPAIMTSHILLKEIDDVYPATLSKAVINKMLRGRLGFKGVVVSDDLDMEAITSSYSAGEAAVGALKAGVDILLICHRREAMIEAYGGVAAAVTEGDIAEEVINNAVKRVLNLKKKFGLI